MSDKIANTISIIVPVYQGEHTLDSLTSKVLELKNRHLTRSGHQFVIEKLILVFDHGPDKSFKKISEIVKQHDFVEPIWLSKNFGQHPACFAGVMKSESQWTVTIDEDGQHDPKHIPDFLDKAIDESVGLVYAMPTNPPPHTFFRNLTSKFVHWTFAILISNTKGRKFHSYRLFSTSEVKQIAVQAKPGLYFDVALDWVFGKYSLCPVLLGEEGHRKSGYRLLGLINHYWRLISSSGTKLMRILTLFGTLIFTISFLLSAYILISYIFIAHSVQGWSSLVLLMLFTLGTLSLSLGMISEYIGILVQNSLGKPLFVESKFPREN